MDRRGGHGELALGVRAEDFGTGGHAANVNEAWGVGEGGANVALEAGHGISGWRGGFLNRSGGGAGEVGLSWGLDPVGVVVGGHHGVWLSLGGGHAVLHERDQAIALDLAPSVAWGETAGGKGDGGEQTDDESAGVGEALGMHEDVQALGLQTRASLSRIFVTLASIGVEFRGKISIT